MSDYMSTYGVGEEAGRRAYRDGYTLTGNETVAFDRGYWAEHDDSFEDNGGGIEDGYGDWFSEVEQGRWDDDPSPYDGTYSEM